MNTNDYLSKPAKDRLDLILTYPEELLSVGFEDKEIHDIKIKIEPDYDVKIGTIHIWRPTDWFMFNITVSGNISSRNTYFSKQMYQRNHKGQWILEKIKSGNIIHLPLNLFETKRIKKLNKKIKHYTDFLKDEITCLFDNLLGEKNDYYK